MRTGHDVASNVEDTFADVDERSDNSVSKLQEEPLICRISHIVR